MIRFIEENTLQIITFSSWNEIIKLGGLNKNLPPGNFINEDCLKDGRYDFLKFITGQISKKEYELIINKANKLLIELENNK